MIVMAVIQRHDADRIARDHPEIRGFVVQAKGEHAAQLFEEVGAVFQVQRQNNLAVGRGAEGIGVLQGMADVLSYKIV